MSMTKEAAPYLVHIGALLYLVCFLFRDQIVLRALAIAGDVTYSAYYLGGTDQPLWNAIYWNVLTVLVNVVMIGIILRDSRLSRFTDDELAMFRNLRGLSPKHFRALLKIGTWTRSAGTDTLTEAGQPVGRLHYVLEGKVAIGKGERTITSGPAVFIGELAFLRDKPATATVSVAPGALYMSWPRGALQAALVKDESLKNALAALLNADMAEKVANA